MAVQHVGWLAYHAIAEASFHPGEAGGVTEGARRYRGAPQPVEQADVVPIGETEGACAHVVEDGQGAVLLHRHADLPRDEVQGFIP